MIVLYNSHNAFQVGSMYKTPNYPIWVVFADNCFAVLFSSLKELLSDEFDPIISDMFVQLKGIFIRQQQRAFELHLTDGQQDQMAPQILSICSNHATVLSNDRNALFQAPRVAMMSQRHFRRSNSASAHGI